MRSAGRRRFIHLGFSAAAGLAASRMAAAESSPGALYLAIYRPGPNWLAGKPTSAQPLREHGKYMLSLYRSGRLQLAGSFGDEAGGAAAFEAEDDAAAQAIVDADPAVTAGVMICDLRRWRVVDWSKL
jgi:uncharacterized protein YciI